MTVNAAHSQKNEVRLGGTIGVIKLILSLQHLCGASWYSVALSESDLYPTSLGQMEKYLECTL